VAEAYVRLDNLLKRNFVKRTVRLTERHEKKGVKRRRLRSERWRKQFANEVGLHQS
jgi:small subunit ribosomal protein MRP21